MRILHFFFSEPLFILSMPSYPTITEMDDTFREQQSNVLSRIANVSKSVANVRHTKSTVKNGNGFRLSPQQLVQHQSAAGSSILPAKRKNLLQESLTNPRHSISQTGAINVSPFSLLY